MRDSVRSALVLLSLLTRFATRLPVFLINLLLIINLWENRKKTNGPSGKQ